jgi:hypothetical protein|eukprot:COSAG01_NODE_22439_length_855_cov_2.326720_1_plen_79_part_00
MAPHTVVIGSDLLDISTSDGEDLNPLQAEAEVLATTLLGEKERLEQKNFSERLAPHIEVPVVHNANRGLNFQAVISAL